MSKRRRATLIEDLPQDIIDRILVGLPSKDIGRCRAVSTSWRSTTSTSEFMLTHHRCQPSFPIVKGSPRPTGLVVFRDDAASQRLWTWTFNWDTECRSEQLLHSTCDGFLIVSKGAQSYICNPVTSKRALLPPPRVGPGNFNFVVGFYRHHPTGEYRVLWFSESKPSSPPNSSLYITTLGSEERRQVRVRMPTVLPPSEEQKVLNHLHTWSFHAPPVRHHGSLHWCPYGAIKTSACGSSGTDIIAFDFEAESFRSIRNPAQSCPNRKLFHMDGTLALWGSSSTHSFSTMDVWAMQDYEAGIWAFKCRIDLSVVEASRQLYLNSCKKKMKKKTPLDSAVEEFNDMAVLNERELLIKFNKNSVLRCDIDGKFLGVVNIGKSQYCMALTQHRLQESIIPIPSHV